MKLNDKIFLLIIIIMAITETDLKQKYKRMLNLSNVENTSDINKLLSRVLRNTLANKLSLTGGTLTGGLTGTTGIFSNDVISNTSGYTGGISMISLYTQLQSLITQISSFSTSSILITKDTLFPTIIPYSYATIDQISNSSGSTGSTRSPYYICNVGYRPIAMTSINASFGFFGAWGIKKSVVNRNVWINDWTFITKLWFDSTVSTNICNRIVVKFGEKWERWDNGSEGVNNRGDQYTASSDANENIYLMINNINNTITPLAMVTVSNMNLLNNNAVGIAPFWLKFPYQNVIDDYKGGVYIIISYNATTSIITINFCISDDIISTTTNIISYISASTYSNLNPLANDMRPFHIYVNGGIPYWFFGMVLFNNSNDTLNNYVQKYRDLFLINYNSI